MSKVDAQRAMREAKYAATTQRPTVTPAAAPAVRTRTEPVPPAGTVVDPIPYALSPSEPPLEPTAAPALCGHRSIGNKSCRRPAGHAEKNHRYT